MPRSVPSPAPARYEVEFWLVVVLACVAFAVLFAVVAELVVSA